MRRVGLFFTFLFLTAIGQAQDLGKDPNLGVTTSEPQVQEAAPVPIGTPSQVDESPEESQTPSDVQAEPKPEPSLDSKSEDANKDAVVEEASKEAEDGEVSDSEESADEEVVAKPATPENLPQWSCRVDTPPQDKGAFTVGEKFVVLCEGETVEFSEGKVHFQMPEPLLYAIKILSVDRVQPNEVILTATSYFKGQHDLKGIVLVEDLVEKFKVAPLILNVRSLIKDPKQKPFGPTASISLGYPIWLWIGLLVFVVLFVFLVLFRFYRRGQKMKVLDGLRFHNSALGSYNQLNKDLRNLNREFVFSKHKAWTQENTNTYITRLDEYFRLYLLREFIVPANDWKTSLVLKEIQKSDRKRFSQYGKLLASYLKELDRAMKSLETLKMEDCQQLTQMARKVTQKIWQVRKTSPTKAGAQ